MSTNIVLNHLRQVDKLTRQITTHSSNIRSTSKDFTYSESNDIYSLEQKLVVMKVYLEEAISELEWCQKIKSRIKEELSMMVLVFGTLFLGVFFFHWFLK
jgi:CRISPR/Cas system CMR-associated protein Cmr5 small subunit